MFNAPSLSGLDRLCPKSKFKDATIDFEMVVKNINDVDVVDSVQKEVINNKPNKDNRPFN